MKTSFSFLLLLALTACVSAHRFSIKFTDDYKMSWTVVENSQVNVTLEYTGGRAWLGVGINDKSEGMTNADMMIARWDTSEPAIEDNFAVGHVPPQTDVSQGGQYNILAPSLAQSDALSVANFSRKLDTGDAKTDYVIQNAWVQTLWAHGQSNVFTYHFSNRGLVTLNWLTGEVLPPAPSNLQVPPGFAVKSFAQVANARTMALSEGGMIYVGSREAGTVSAFHVDSPGAVQTLASGLEMPTGVAIEGGSLFVVTVTAVRRYDDIDAYVSAHGTLPPNPVTLATFAEPPSTQHAWKMIAVRGGTVYTSVNSPCNICEYNQTYGDFITFSAKDGSNRVTHFRGIRDTQGFDFDPRSGNLWWSDNGRDQWDPDHNNRPPDELNYFDLSQTQASSSSSAAALPHYGFPYCYGGGQEASGRHAPQEPDFQFNANGDCAPYVPAVFDFRAHVASLGVHFYTGDQFPPAFKNALFVAEHGSWNRQPAVGQQIDVLRFNAAPPFNVDFSVFLTGFLHDDGAVTGRPVAFLQLPDGSLLFSDDLRGYIYQIEYTG
jgi:glucose/arabinose dehydrogenase